MGHLEELRQLRSRLEESIKTYDELCAQLEEKLKELGGGEGEEDVLKESMSLIKENESLRLKIGKFNEEMQSIQQQLDEHRLTRKRLVRSFLKCEAMLVFLCDNKITWCKLQTL